jgi:hypothetical protein
MLPNPATTHEPKPKPGQMDVGTVVKILTGKCHLTGDSAHLQTTLGNTVCIEFEVVVRKKFGKARQKIKCGYCLECGRYKM